MSDYPRVIVTKGKVINVYGETFPSFTMSSLCFAIKVGWFISVDLTPRLETFVDPSDCGSGWTVDASGNDTTKPKTFFILQFDCKCMK